MFAKELEIVYDKPAVSNPSLEFNTLCIMFYIVKPQKLVITIMNSYNCIIC